MTIFIVIYAILLILYMFSETSGKLYFRAPNKIAMSSMFLIYALIMYFTHFTPFADYHVILPIAIFFAFLGDILLLYKFIYGAISFFLSNILFGIYEVAQLSNFGTRLSSIGIFIIISVVISIIFSFIFGKNSKVKEKKLVPEVILYLFAVTFNGILGLGTIVLLNGTPFILLGLGTIMFMISDYFIAIYEFVLPGNKWFLRANSFVYFTGLLLIVVGMGL